MVVGRAFGQLSESTLEFKMKDFFFFFSGLCRAQAMVAYTKPQQRKKEESEQLRG